MSTTDIPRYIPPSIVTAPLEFSWEGALDHIGPTETVTPLLKLLSGTTTTAQIAMCAGVLTWGIWRLKDHTDVSCSGEFAQAAFAYTADWRYLDRDAVPAVKAPDQPPALSAITQLHLFLRAALGKKQWDSYYQPVRETFHSAHIVRHILPKSERTTFDEWLQALVARVKSHWSKPDEPFRKKDTFATPEEREQFIARHRGCAIPPQILDPAFDYHDADRIRLVGEFLAQLDPRANRYLRPAESMRELGFAGVPYRLT